MNLSRLLLLSLCLLPYQLLSQDIEIDFENKVIIRSQDRLEIKDALNTNWVLSFENTKIKFTKPELKDSSFYVKEGLGPESSQIDDFSFDEQLISEITDKGNLFFKFGENIVLTLENSDVQETPRGKEEGDTKSVGKIDIAKIPSDPKFVYSYMFQSADNKTDYQLVIDFENEYEKLRKRKGDRWIDVKNKALTSNRTLALKIISNAQNKSYDRIGHDVTYQTFFLEDGDRFRELIGGQSQEQEDPTTDPADSNEGPPAGEEGAETTSEEEFELLRNAVETLEVELFSFTNYVFGTYPKQQNFDISYEAIKQSIIGVFGISSFNTSGFLAALSTAAQDREDIHQLISPLSLYFQKLDNYKVYSPDFLRVKRADELGLELKFYEEGTEDPIATRTFDYGLKGGWKIDFSTGLFYTKLRKKSYTTIDVASTIDDQGNDDPSDDETIEQKQIVLESDNNSSMGLGILTHFYPKLTSRTNIGGTFGFVVKDDIASEFVAGASLMIPAFKRQRIVISGGGVYGEETVLRSKYAEGQTLAASLLTNVSDDQLTIGKNRWSWFVSFTLNFGSVDLQK